MPQQPSTSSVALVFDGLARVVLIALVAILPLAVIPAAWGSIAQSKILLVAFATLLAAVFWALARLFEGTMHIPRTALMYAVLLLPVAYAISAAAAGFSGAAIVGVGVEQDTLAAVIMWYAVFALTALLFSNHQAGLRTMMRAMVVGFTALFILKALHIFFPEQLSFNVLQGATANLLGNWHDLGIVAALSLFMSLALFRTGTFNGAWRFLLIALGLASVFFLIVVHFVDVLWGAAALTALAGLAALRSSIQADGLPLFAAIMRSLVPILLAIFFALAAVFGTPLWDKLPAPILVTEVEVRPSWQGTFDVGRQSLGAPAELVFGTGPNSFVREWGMHKPEGVNATPFWNADFNYGVGIIPTAIFTSGIVGLIAWFAIAVVVLGLMWRFVREPRPLSGRRALFGVLLVSAAFLVVFHMIYTPGIVLTTLMFVILGLLAVVVAGDRPQRVLTTDSILNAVVFAVVVLCAVPVAFAAALSVREVASNLFVNRGAVVYQASGDVGAAGRMLQTALEISPRNDRAHRAAAELGLVEFGSLLSKGDPQTDEARLKLQTTLQNTIQHGLTAVEIDDANYQNWLLLAQVYGSLAGVNIEGAYEQAKTNYERASQANPSNPLPKLRLAQLAAARGDIAGARTSLQEAIALKQDFAAAYYLLSQVEAADNKGDAAVQAASVAVQLVPDDPLGWFNLGYILYLGGVYNDAAIALEQAVARANDYSNALFYLGASYYQLQRPQEAVLAYQRILQLNPNETWINQVIANIQSGQDPFAGVSQVGEQ
ncbi:MAG: tetratricopeptide repeat protein [Minisyncoccia bacterium]